MGKYDDILNHPRLEPKNHLRMPIEKRAAQFAPFAALEGFDDQYAESARITSERMELDEDKALAISQTINWIWENISIRPKVEVTYFEADAKKSGGKYVFKKESVRWVDFYDRKLVFTDGTTVPIADIIEIDMKMQ